MTPRQLLFHSALAPSAGQKEITFLCLCPVQGTPQTCVPLCKKDILIYSVSISPKIPRKDVLDVVHMLGVII